MANKSIEKSVCVDSFNRDVQAYPDPADFVVSLGGRYEIYQVVLTTLELPSTCWLVEPQWSTFSFDLGLQTPHLLTEQAYRLLSRQPDPAADPDIYDIFPASTEAILPPPFATATVTSAGINTSVIELFGGLRHGLTNASLGVLRQQVYVYSGAIAPFAGPPFEVIQVISATELLVNGVLSVGDWAVLLVSGGGPNTLSSPQQLVDVVNANLAEYGWAMRMEYDSFNLQATLNVPDYSIEQYITDANSSLLVFLSFTSVSELMVASRFPIRSRLFPLNRYTARLTPGNYDLAAFKRQIEQTLNPQILTGNAPQSSFVILSGNVLYDIVLGPIYGPTNPFFPPPLGGGYHPQDMANAITTAIGLVFADVVLNFDDARDAFVFSSLGGIPFTLNWNSTEPDQLLASNLGFDATTVRIAAFEQVGAPRKFFSMPMTPTLPFSYNGDTISSVRKFFFACKQRALPTLPVDVSDATGDLTVGIGKAPIGVLLYCPTDNYIVYTIGNSAGVLLCQPVVPPTVPLGHGVKVYYPIPYLSCGLNFYFDDIPKMKWNRLAEVLGFNRGTFSLAPQPVLVPPNNFNLEPPAYVLLDIDLNQFSANFVHKSGNDVRYEFMGKVVLFANYRYERTSGITRIGTGTSYVSDLHISLLTPWHSLIDLHGRNWSCTLVFGSTFQKVVTEIQ